MGYTIHTNPEDLSWVTDHLQSVDTFTAIRDFYEGFPEYLSNKLWITGESYAGINGPYLAYQIHTWNKEVKSMRMNGQHVGAGKQLYNLAGFIIGNGATDFNFDTAYVYAETVHHYKLINDTIYKEYQDLGCEYWYRDLRIKSNPARCDEIYYGVVRKVFSEYNIYDLMR